MARDVTGLCEPDTDVVSASFFGTIVACIIVLFLGFWVWLWLWLWLCGVFSRCKPRPWDFGLYCLRILQFFFGMPHFALRLFQMILLMFLRTFARVGAVVLYCDGVGILIFFRISV